MLTVVLVLNVLIALLCLYVAWQVWKLQRVLAKVADTLISVERRTYAVLHGAPEAIASGKRNTRKLRQQYRELETQLQRATQVLGLLSLGQRAWQMRSSQTRRQKRSQKEVF